MLMVQYLDGRSEGIRTFAMARIGSSTYSFSATPTCTVHALELHVDDHDFLSPFEAPCKPLHIPISNFPICG